MLHVGQTFHKSWQIGLKSPLRGGFNYHRLGFFTVFFEVPGNNFVPLNDILTTSTTNTMKTLIFALVLLTGSVNIQASSQPTGEGNPRENALKKAVQRQVNKFLFFPVMKESSGEAEADIMLQVYPNGEIKPVFIKTENNLIRAFLVRQISRMRIDPEKVVAYAVFRFRLAFRRQA